MKEGIHPKYVEARIQCGSCGTIIETHSTRPSMHLDVCSKCHPFYTGEHRIVDTAGRVERFNRRYARPSQ